MSGVRARQGVAILGSTGSIGTTALRVLDRQRERFRVVALTAFNNAALLAQQSARIRGQARDAPADVKSLFFVLSIG